jgi:hypothetical protein
MLFAVLHKFLSPGTLDTIQSIGSNNYTYPMKINDMRIVLNTFDDLTENTLVLFNKKCL